MANNEGNKVNPGTFGHGVLGKELHAAEQKVVERQADVFGPGVVGLPTDPKLNVLGHGVAKPAAPVTPAAPLPMLSVAALKKTLAASPLLVDTLLAAELARPDRRKGALEAILEAEQRRPGGGRFSVLDQIDSALNGVSEAEVPAPIEDAPAHGDLPTAEPDAAAAPPE